jgi:hypothetical protein
VPGRHIAALPTTPHDHTLLRDPATGTVYVTAGRAKVAFAGPDELTGCGYDWTQWNVPTRHLAALPDRPHDGTLLRDPTTGRIFVVAGGAKFDFANPTELIATGYGWTQVTVPARYLATLPATPTDGTVLRSPATGQRWRVSGGRRATVDTVAGAEPPATAIPDRLLGEIPLA